MINTSIILHHSKIYKSKKCKYLCMIQSIVIYVRGQSEYFVLPATSLFVKAVQVFCVFNHNDCIKWFYGIFSKREGECKFLFILYSFKM